MFLLEVRTFVACKYNSKIGYGGLKYIYFQVRNWLKGYHFLAGISVPCICGFLLIYDLFVAAFLHVDHREELHESGFKGDSRKSAYCMKSIAVVVRNLVAMILS